jgi:hypothetical protein
MELNVEYCKICALNFFYLKVPFQEKFDRKKSIVSFIPAPSKLAG